jgi:Yip1 domain
MSVLQHALGILVSPASEWRAIRAEKNSFLKVFLGHVPLFALIPSVSAYIGVTQVGWTVAGGDPVKLTPESAISLCALTYVALLASIYVLGEFVNWMSKTYGVSDADDHRHYAGTALAVYVSTPILLAGIANLYPQMWIVAAAMGVAGAYAIYLIYEGLPILMDIPKERAFLFASSIVTVALVLMITVMIVTVVIWGMGVGPIYVD